MSFNFTVSFAGCTASVSWFLPSLTLVGVLHQAACAYWVMERHLRMHREQGSLFDGRVQGGTFRWLGACQLRCVLGAVHQNTPPLSRHEE